MAIKRQDCPDHVPLPESAKGYDSYGPGNSIEVSSATERQGLLALRTEMITGLA